MKKLLLLLTALMLGAVVLTSPAQETEHVTAKTAYATHTPFTYHVQWPHFPATTTTVAPEPEPEPAPVVTRSPQAKTVRPRVEGGGGNTSGVNINCESGGNYAYNDGTYFGAYNFDHDTWQSAGGSTHNADTASVEEQDRVAAGWVASGHRGAWPNC